MKQLTNEEKAYIAGLVDGEGSISCSYLGTGRPSLFAVVSMCSEELTFWLHECFGGAHYRLETKQAHWQTCWAFQLNGKDCKTFLEAIQPYIRLKKRSVELALMFIETIKERNQRNKGLTDSELLIKLRIAQELRSLTGHKKPVEIEDLELR